MESQGKVNQNKKGLQMLVATMWVYDSIGRKIGEYEIPGYDDQADYAAALAEWCIENGLTPSHYNQCVGKTEEV